MPRILNINEKILKALEKFDLKREPNLRYASFDYCYRYFLSFKNKKQIASRKFLQTSCFQLGFYLASWGMYRGSSFLAKEKSARHFTNLIKWIANCDKVYWTIDVNNYDEENIEKLLTLYCEIGERLELNGRRKIVLVTKIMLGVFGNVPAFDDFFTATFRKYSNKTPAFRSFNKEELLKIKEFYDENHQLIEEQRRLHKVFDFESGRETRMKYTRAKIIDMVGFGYRLSN